MQVLRSEVAIWAPHHLVGPGFQELAEPDVAREASRVRARQFSLRYTRNGHSQVQGDVAKRARLYRAQNQGLPGVIDVGKRWRLSFDALKPVVRCFLSSTRSQADVGSLDGNSRAARGKTLPVTGKNLPLFYSSKIRVRSSSTWVSSFVFTPLELA